jgi:tetratricopeptide (TPR) repeat protein
MLVICLSAAFLLTGASAGMACKHWAKVVSAEGEVTARRVGETLWKPAELNVDYCPGDMAQTGVQSRAGLYLFNEVTLRMDQNSTITFPEGKENTVLIKLMEGAAHFFSRKPRGLRVDTPFYTGTVEGTEFVVRVDGEGGSITVLEGQVLMANELGSLVLQSGQAGEARKGQAPVMMTVVRPRDAVHWTLYYPPLVDYKTTDFTGSEAWQGAAREAMRLYWQGDLSGALAALDTVDDAAVNDPRFFACRVGLLIGVGRVDDAEADIALLAKMDPSEALAFRSVIAVVQNRKDEALELAVQASNQKPDSTAPWVALSYARQAHFDLKAAMESLERAVSLNPADALVWARLSEIYLSLGDLNESEDAARKAVEINPNLGRSHTVLGFALLTRIKIHEAAMTFAKAISLNSADPLPRLGLGLAKIRRGDLAGGRAEIEIAVSLDPGNSLIRSYLGKAFYEEKRDHLAARQFNAARELDPKDPTPWFYDAIRKQSVNQPAGALEDIQASIDLNDNRAVYRSQLMLDQDLASRSAGLARIYNELGFKQLALSEGFNSLSVDPVNYSAHRFLADSYHSLPRHEIARVSELLQAQLLQPININPIQPQLAEGGLSILEGAGPSDPGFNEYTPLFVRNQLSFQANGVAGGKDTLGDDMVVSGIYDALSFSLGQFHYETDGFRENNDQEHNIYNAFAQAALTPDTSIQAECRYKSQKTGDLSLLFDPDAYIRGYRVNEQSRSFRAGLHHRFAPGSEVIASVNYLDSDKDYPNTLFKEMSTYEDEGIMTEGQYLFRASMFTFITGLGYFDKDTTNQYSNQEYNVSMTTDMNTKHTNLYLYSLINFPHNVVWTLGASGDFFEDYNDETDQFNPKFGVTWNPLPGTTIRAAAFRTLKRSLISDQTLEPTSVAGFNQFFDDGNGADAWRYGTGIDQKFTSTLYAGAEYSKRELEETGMGPPDFVWKDYESDEYLGRAYVYWIPHPWVSVAPEYQFEQFENPAAFAKRGFSNLDTHRFSLGVNFFHPCGLTLRVKPTYVDQSGDFVVPGPPPDFFAEAADNDEFWVVDASIGYQLPARTGRISLEFKNLFDESFKFQDTDPDSPDIYPEQMVLARFTFIF